VKRKGSTLSRRNISKKRRMSRKKNKTKKDSKKRVGLASKKIQMNIAKRKNKMFVELNKQIQKVEIYFNKKKLDTLKSGKSFDITKYVAYSKGLPLELIIHDKKGTKQKHKLDILSNKPFITRIDRATEIDMMRAQKLFSKIRMERALVFPLVTGTYSGPIMQENRYRFPCLRIDGDRQDKEVEDIIEVTVDLRYIPLGVSVEDDRIYLNISNSEGQIIYETVAHGPLENLRLEINLADRTGSTHGEYTIWGMLMTNLHTRGTEFTWHTTNRIKIYYGVEMPIVYQPPFGVYIPRLPPTDLPIPSDGLYGVRAYIDKHVVDPDEDFTITWDSTGAPRYEIRSGHATRIPEGGTYRYWPFTGDSERSLTTHASEAFLFEAADETATEFYADDWVILNYKVSSIRGSNRYDSNSLIVYVKPPGDSKPNPPVLGIERCGIINTPQGRLGGDQECGAGVYLFWSHETEEEGYFAIEKGRWEGEIPRFEIYRDSIPSDQRHLFVPLSDLNLNDTSIFRMYFRRPIEVPEIPDDIEGFEVVEEFGTGFFGSIEADWRSLYSNKVAIHIITPPILLSMFWEPLICSICFRWTPNNIADQYEFEVSDDPNFSDRERIFSRMQPAHPEDYEDIEGHEDCVELFGPVETLGCVSTEIFSDVRMLYARVRCIRGRDLGTSYGNWSNVLFLRIPE
jgi:hypothetical protein